MKSVSYVNQKDIQQAREDDVIVLAFLRRAPIKWKTAALKIQMDGILPEQRLLESIWRLVDEKKARITNDLCVEIIL